ncbi:lipase family protein [Lyngbya confervoides]|uniref:Lipase family protein n=1 Tax=Lyngbya confervoides BDU141951 TaxID=1574623 RepID=A0ABD4T1T6_9CYAN|nr:lipase family protein [Lyngbya confervoides]MCM1982565.1 lipase family protein [Lyngbya confervoides BDU141951]
MERKIHYQDLLDYALRAQSAYFLSELGWTLSTQLGWHRPQRHLLIQEVPVSEVNVVLEVDDEHRRQWIAVRGSSNLRNWLLNLRYTQRQCPPQRDRPWPGSPLGKNHALADPCGNVDLHQGFRQAATEVFHALAPHLRANYQIRLTGHSLGGAIAAILMLFLAEKGFSVEQCVTFGQPKITDPAGAQDLADRPLIRVIHDDDIVPHLPPTSPFTRWQGGYAHFGQEILLHDSEQVGNTLIQTWKPPIRPAQGLWASLQRSLFRRNIREIHEHVEDHSLHHYIHSLVKTLAARQQLSPAQRPLLKTLALGTALPFLPEETLAPGFANA